MRDYDKQALSYWIYHLQCCHSQKTTCVVCKGHGGLLQQSIGPPQQSEHGVNLDPDTQNPLVKVHYATSPTGPLGSTFNGQAIKDLQSLCGRQAPHS